MCHHRHIIITATKETTSTSKLLHAFCGPGRVLNVYLFNPHRNLMLSLKIRKGRLSEFQKFSRGNTVKCRVMLSTIIFGYHREDRAITKTETLGRTKELNKTQTVTISGSVLNRSDWSLDSHPSILTKANSSCFLLSVCLLVA